MRTRTRIFLATWNVAVMTSVMQLSIRVGGDIRFLKGQYQN